MASIVNTLLLPTCQAKASINNDPLGPYIINNKVTSHHSPLPALGLSSLAMVDSKEASPSGKRHRKLEREHARRGEKHGVDNIWILHINNIHINMTYRQLE